MKLGNLTITNYTIEKMKDNACRQVNLGGMYFAESGDQVRFLYNDSWREGLIDYIWKWGRKWATCYMTVEFNDGMEDVENSSYKNFSLDKVKGFEVIRKGEQYGFCYTWRMYCSVINFGSRLGRIENG